MRVTAVPAGQSVPASPEEPGDPAAEVTSVEASVVHRSDDSDVLLTHFQQIGADRYRFAVRWPDAHALFNPVAGQQNPLLIAETVRQAGTALAHVEYGAAMDDHFLLWNLHYEVPAEVAAAGFPTPTIAVVRCPEVKMRGRRLAVIHVQLDLFRDSVFLGRAGASANCVSNAAYKRLRPARPGITIPPLPEPVLPERVGRTDPQDVLLTPAGRGGTWRLRADGSHPVIFDSQNDHMPGRGVLEAMRQAAQLATGFEYAVAAGVRAEFCHYIELDRPCTVTVHPEEPLPSGQRAVRVVLIQDDEVAAEGVLLMQDAAPYPTAAPTSVR